MIRESSDIINWDVYFQGTGWTELEITGFKSQRDAKEFVRLLQKELTPKK